MSCRFAPTDLLNGSIYKTIKKSMLFGVLGCITWVINTNIEINAVYVVELCSRENTIVCLSSNFKRTTESLLPNQYWRIIYQNE